MSKLTSILIASLFASSIAFAADAPKADTATPAAKSTVAAPTATKAEHGRKHTRHQKKHAVKAATPAAAAPVTK